MATVRVRNLQKQVTHIIVKQPVDYTGGGSQVIVNRQGLGMINKTVKKTAPSRTVSLMPKGLAGHEIELERSEVTQDVIKKAKAGLVEIIEN